MRTRNLLSAAALGLALVVAPIVLAQTPAQPGVDPSAAVTLEGPVISFSAGPGARLPVLTLDDAALGATSVRLGPVWYLTEKGFTATAGDRVRALAYPCSFCEQGWAAATVDNLSTGASIALRDATGLPLWLGSSGSGAPTPGAGRGPGMGKGQGQGPGGGSQGGPGSPGGGAGAAAGPGLCGGQGPDLTQAQTVSGSVVSFSGAPGVRYPVLTLRVEGQELVLIAGPYRVWQTAGFTPAEGQELTVTYAPVHLEEGDHLVAITVIDPATGIRVDLRDPETGLPAMGGHGYRH